MEANTILNTANDTTQIGDTKYGAHGNGSDLARSKFSDEAVQSMDKTCPGMPAKHHEGGTLVGSGSYTVPDQPGVKCAGGIMEIPPVWSQFGGSANVPPDRSDRPKTPPVRANGSEGDGTAPNPDHRLTSDWHPAQPMPLPNRDQTPRPRIPADDDHRRPYRPF